MADTRPTVAILGMAGVEPHVQGKGLALGLALEKFDPPVHDQIGLVTERTIRLFLVKGCVDRIVDLEVIAGLGNPWASWRATCRQTRSGNRPCAGYPGRDA